MVGGTVKDPALVFGVEVDERAPAAGSEDVGAFDCVGEDGWLEHAVVVKARTRADNPRTTRSDLTPSPDSQLGPYGPMVGTPVGQNLAAYRP
ncbi:MAG TPA: hypothetical protein VK773_14395 [Acidimicrobiales bacterium]|nr:hypothetical protein [Acidimicrobiales bacterium]